MKKIEMGKKYRTRGGHDFELLATNIKNIKPVVGVVTYSTGSQDVQQWYGDGRFCKQANSLDLIEFSPYEDIPIDTPGWARRKDDGEDWQPRYFSGVDPAGRPKTWTNGATSFSTNGLEISWDEFTTTKPEGVE